MKYLGIEFDVKNHPLLDSGYIPFEPWIKAYLAQAHSPIAIAVERTGGKRSVYHSFIRDDSFAEANYRYVERLVKFLLWSIGGYKVYICGCDALTERLKNEYCDGGKRSFDAGFTVDVFERELVIVACSADEMPGENEGGDAIGGHMDGCRIGFDAGGSDRKVSAVIDGETVYSEEVVWFPKTNEDPQYHFEGILDSFKRAASKMPRVDAIGVSSAGVYVDNCPMVASLFIKVPKEKREDVKSIYKRAAAEIGNVPLTVANDGDVTALAGAMSLGTGGVLGIAMGTSEAVGYISPDGKVTGWLNELAFAPVDLSEDALEDEWSHDVGVGCKYFSQDAVIKLAPAAGIELDASLSLAEKLKAVQKLVEEGHEGAANIFTSIGTYLGHTLALYSRFYEIKYVLVLGRVASGKGGELIIDECRRVIADEYPEMDGTFTVMMPDEKTRRVGQSVAAASLPEISK